MVDTQRAKETNTGEEIHTDEEREKTFTHTHLHIPAHIHTHTNTPNQGDQVVLVY
jgi:hypothetical protein